MSEPLPPSPTPDEHDAWLYQALLHAPDASATPPDALRQAILAEARSAVKGAPARAARPARLDSLAAFWSWLARPPVAAGFASVMAATLVGMMWWDRPMDQTLAPPPARVVAAPPSAKADASASLQTVPAATGALAAPNAAVADKPSAAPEAPRIVAAKRAAPPATEALERRELAGVAADKKRQDQPKLESVPATPAVTPFPIERRRDADTARGSAVAADSAEKAERQSAPAPVISPSTAKDEPGAATNALIPNETQRRAEARSFEAPNATAPPPAPAPATTAAPQSRITARASVSSERADRVEPSLRPLGELLGSLAHDPEPWSRIGARGQPAPLDAATRSWLASVDAVAAGLWQMQAERARRLDGALVGDAGSVSLHREGHIALRVRLEERGVLVEAASGPAWFAPLSAEALARLRATLPPIDR